MADLTEPALPHWFAALDDDDRAECVSELRSCIPDLWVGAAEGVARLEDALAAWRRTREALSDPTARDILTGPLDLDEFTEVGPPPPSQYIRREDVVTMLYAEAEFESANGRPLGSAALRRFAALLKGDVHD